MASFKKLGNENWQVSFYCKDYLGENRKYKKSGFKTKKEASDFSIEFINKQNGSSNIRILTLAKEFIEYKKRFLKLNSIKAYNLVYKYIEKDKFSKIELKEIEKRDCIKFIEKFLETPSKTKQIKLFLKMIFDYAEIHYNFKNKNVINFKLNLVKQKDEKESLKNIWTLDEFKTFENILFSSKTKLKTILLFNLLFFTGARVGEITALTINDIDLKNKTININKTRISNEIKNSPKTKSSNRIISIPDKVINLLKEYLKNFVNIKGLELFSCSFFYRRALKLIIQKHNLKNISLHSFRHSHASHLIKLGVPITDISKRLGHANSKITLETYSHFYDDKKDNIVEILNKNI